MIYSFPCFSLCFAIINNKAIYVHGTTERLPPPSDSIHHGFIQRPELTADEAFQLHLLFQQHSKRKQKYLQKQRKEVLKRLIQNDKEWLSHHQPMTKEQKKEQKQIIQQRQTTLSTLHQQQQQSETKQQLIADLKREAGVEFRFCFIGDSVIAGVGVTEKKDTFQYQLSQHLAEQLHEYAMEVLLENDEKANFPRLSFGSTSSSHSSASSVTDSSSSSLTSSSPSSSADMPHPSASSLGITPALLPSPFISVEYRSEGVSGYCISDCLSLVERFDPSFFTAPSQGDRHRYVFSSVPDNTNVAAAQNPSLIPPSAPLFASSFSQPLSSPTTSQSLHPLVYPAIVIDAGINDVFKWRKPQVFSQDLHNLIIKIRARFFSSTTPSASEASSSSFHNLISDFPSSLMYLRSVSATDTSKIPVFVCTIPPLDRFSLPWPFSAVLGWKVKQLNAAIKDVCSSMERVHVIDISSAFPTSNDSKTDISSRLSSLFSSSLNHHEPSHLSSTTNSRPRSASFWALPQSAHVLSNDLFASDAFHPSALGNYVLSHLCSHFIIREHFKNLLATQKTENPRAEEKIEENWTAVDERV